MLNLILPATLALAGLGAGIGAGIALKPTAAAPAQDGADAAPECAATTAIAAAAAEVPPEPPTDSDFVKLANQFVVPVVRDGAVAAMVVLNLTLEVAEDAGDAVRAREPKLRDSFLRVLLDHANAGGFDGAFTANGTMDSLRGALLEVGRNDAGPGLRNILILDINRQDAG
ncbi:MAG: flagellar basal body-associated FliL family protein [Tranquillimonas sp.]|jgi:hypothetical protein